MADVPEKSVPDEMRPSEDVEGDRGSDPLLSWSAATVVHDGLREADAIAPESDRRAESVERNEALGEHVELDLAAYELGDTTSPSPVAPSSERAVELENEHWRQRAIVWRERAMAAELVAKMLQRNLDDLRANVEDLRLKVEAAAAADAERAAAIESSETPWRRFVRDMYRKYVG